LAMQPDGENLHVLIYARDDVVLVLRREIYAEMHRHHAMQLTLALEQDFRPQPLKHVRPPRTDILHLLYAANFLYLCSWI